MLSGEKIYFYDNLGVRQEIDKNSIWGFARNGVLYIKVQDTFNRITFFGSIIHFVADVTTVSPHTILTDIMIPITHRTAHPISSRYYNSLLFALLSPYSSTAIHMATSPTRTDLQMFMIDFETGK